MNDQPYVSHDRDGVPLVFTPDERKAWRKFADDTPEVIVCILFILLCIAVCILTSAGPVTLGSLGSHWQVPHA